MLTSGITHVSGGLPECIGAECSDYPGCLRVCLDNVIKINELLETSAGQRALSTLSTPPKKDGKNDQSRADRGRGDEPL